MSEPDNSQIPSPRNHFDDEIYDAKRSRACDACRNSKVRCEQPDPDLPCKRCAKSRRECVSPTRTQKRRRSLAYYDQLSAMSGKIDNLTAALSNESTSANPRSGLSGSSREGTMTPKEDSSNTNMSRSADSPSRMSLTEDLWALQNPAPSLPDRSERDPVNSRKAPKIEVVSQFIENGLRQIVSSRTASAIFDRYCIELSMSFPAIVIDPSVSASDVRSSRPTLFLAILAASSGGVCDDDTRKRLRCLLAIVLKHCLSRENEYSLELVQATIISALWHAPLDLMSDQESMDIEELSQAAAQIATHIRLDRQAVSNLPGLKGSQQSRDSGISDNSSTTDLEVKRTWLACYFICINASMRSQQPSFLCWNQYMADCLRRLQTSPQALPSDKLFCRHIRLQRATDEYSRKVFTSHLFGSTPVSTNAPHILENFRNQAAEGEDLSLSGTDGFIKILYHSSALYVYEAIVTTDGGSDSTLMEFELEADRFHGGGTQALLPIADGIELAYQAISAFTSLELSNIRCMPVVFHIRVVHALMFLIKNYVINNCEPTVTVVNSSFERSSEDIKEQLSHMIAILDHWRPDWPADKLTEIVTEFRQRLQSSQNMNLAISDNPSQDNTTPYRARSPPSVNPSALEMPMNLQFQDFGQQILDFKQLYSPSQDGTIYNDPSFWDGFFEQQSPAGRPIPPMFNQPITTATQQSALSLSDANFPTPSLSTTGPFPDNNEPQIVGGGRRN